MLRISLSPQGKAVHHYTFPGATWGITKSQTRCIKLVGFPFFSDMCKRQKEKMHMSVLYYLKNSSLDLLPQCLCLTSWRLGQGLLVLASTCLFPLQNQEQLQK